jgi:hypothetical protein
MDPIFSKKTQHITLLKLFPSQGHSSYYQSHNIRAHPNIPLLPPEAVTDLLLKTIKAETFLPNYVILCNFVHKKTHEIRASIPIINCRLRHIFADSRNWNITPDGLLITFDTYQVGPGAAGPQQVNVPYNALGSVINSQGPLIVVLR